MRFEHPIRLAAPRARVDRGGALYLSRERVPGFSAEARGVFFALTPGEALVAAFAEWARPLTEGDPLAGPLARLQGGEGGDLPLLIEGIKLLDLAAPEAAVEAYERRVRQRAAACLRQKSGGGRLWLCAACARLARQGLTKQ